MLRVLVLLSLFALALWSCGPDKPRTCSGDGPAFKVVLRLSARPLPADTVVHVTYAGSGKEDFRLSDRGARHEVTFCQIADENGAPLDDASAPEATGAAGAAGTAGDVVDSGAEVVAALYCQLFTAGFTELTVTGTGFTTVDYQLTPTEDHCTVTRDYVLDSHDAG